MAEVNNDRGIKWYSTREPLILIVLSTLAIVFFVAVSALSRTLHTRQELLGERWFRRATADQKAGHLDRAIGEFQAAELYSRDSFLSQLSLAQVLAVQGRTDEAYSYLLNLREQQPDNGTVNLELARILARKGDITQTTRYYHNAIYAIWPNDPDEHRIAVSLELIEFLFANNVNTQAQSELIAMASNLPTDAAVHTRVGNLFMKAQDYDHALEQFREAIRIDRRNSAALAGAGRASFELAHYTSARRYLEEALAITPNDSANTDLLTTVTLALDMDPFRRKISVSQRNQAVMEAFATAGARLQTCPPSTTESSFEDRWKEMKPHVSEAGLRRNPDLVESAMDLAFAVEEQSSSQCGAPSGKDLALLLVSKLHEGSER
jgi:tetratricopeptide (TPR) repeat protein